MVMLSDNSRFLRRLFYVHVSASILSMFGAMANIMANSIIAGKFFGSEGLAVMSISAPFYSIFAAIGSLIGVGGSTLASHAIGQDDQSKANTAFTLSIFLSFQLSIIVAIICLIEIEPILYIAGCSPEIYQSAYEYSRIFLIGGFGTAMFYLPYNFFKLIGKLKLLICLFLAMAISNTFLDLLFINLGWGIDAIAFGTIIASIGVAVIGIFY